MAKKYDHLVKLMLIGDSGVGKTAILVRFVDNEFTPSFMTTIGIDFKIKTINVNNKKVKMQIWDTAGQERFHTITKPYYRGAMGIVMVFAVDDQQSFLNIRTWLQNIEDNAQDGVHTLVLANKCDIAPEERDVSKDDIINFSEENNIAVFETSAKTNKGIDEAFKKIACEIITKMARQKPESNGNNNYLDLAPTKEASSGFSCCNTSN